jgi:hypothetical protein
MPLFRRKRVGQGPADAFRGLRDQVLALVANDLDGALAQVRMRALLMETGYDKAIVSLVAIADETVSLYVSNGGGIIGAGQHESVREAARRLDRPPPRRMPHSGPPVPTPRARSERSAQARSRSFR